MNLLADESIDGQIVNALREKGYIVGYVADDVVLGLANREEVLLLTADKDFGELVFRLRRLSSGVVLVRLAGLSPIKKADLVVPLIMKHFNELIKSFSVITPTGIRIRHQIV